MNSQLMYNGAFWTTMILKHEQRSPEVLEYATWIWQKWGLRLIRALSNLVVSFIKISQGITTINIVTNFLMDCQEHLKSMEWKNITLAEISNSRAITEVSEAIRLRLLIKPGSKIISLSNVTEFGDAWIRIHLPWSKHYEGDDRMIKYITQCSVSFDCLPYLTKICIPINTA